MNECTKSRLILTATIVVSLIVIYFFGDPLHDDPKWEVTKVQRWDDVTKTYLLDGRGYITTSDGKQHSIWWNSEGSEEVEDLPEDQEFGWVEYTQYKNVRYARAMNRTLVQP